MPVNRSKTKTVAGHVGLNVTDLSCSRDFYVSALGLEVMTESETEGRPYAFLTDGQRLVLSLWEQSEGRCEVALPGLHHLAFEVESVEEVSRTEMNVRKLGAHMLFDGIVAHSKGAKSGGIFFLDPDGIRLEVYALDAGEGRDAPYGNAPTCGFR